jgi:hypothetical protein
VKKCSFFSLSLSLLNCVLQQNSSSFYMKFCIKSETTFERRREKKGNILAKTLIIRPYKMVLCPYKKFLAKEDHKKPTLVTEFLKPTETLLLSSRIQKKQKPLLITRAQKNVASPVVESRF